MIHSLYFIIRYTHLHIKTIDRSHLRFQNQFYLHELTSQWQHLNLYQTIRPPPSIQNSSIIYYYLEAAKLFRHLSQLNSYSF